MKLTGTVIGKFCGKDQLGWRLEEMTLIVCLFVLFLNNGTSLNLLQQRNIAVVDGLVVEADSDHLVFNSVSSL